MSIIHAEKCRATTFAWLLLFLISGGQATYSQTYFFDNYGVKQGLREQKIYTLHQDSNDYLWLGTANGLSRFDGRNFRNFTRADSLAPGGVVSIFEDSMGYLWFGHLNGGITRFNGQKFERVRMDSLTIKGDVTSIAVAGKKIWFTTTSQGALMAEYPVKDIGKVKVKQYTGRDNLSDQTVGAAVLADTSYICITNGGLMRRFNDEENKFEIFRMPHYTTYFATITLMQDSKGNLWFGTYNGGLYKYILSQSKMQVIDLIRSGMSSNWVSCITEDRKGNIWIGTWGGGIAMIEDSVPRIYNNSNGLIPNKISDILADVEGNILISDHDNGLTVFKGDAFITYNAKEYTPKDEKYKPGQSINAIYEDKNGEVWFGTNAGIARFTPGSGKDPVIYNRATNELYEDIKYIHRDSEGNLWIGSTDGGVIVYNISRQRFEAQPFVNSYFPTNLGMVTAMEIDRKNNIWIGTVDGVIRGTIGAENFQRIISMDSLTVARITALYSDPSGDVWIGTEPRANSPTLIRYIANKDEFRTIPAFTGVKPTSMVMDKKGVLWIGTNEGLRAFRNDSVFLSISTSDGLLSDVINLLEAGDDGSILIGTNNGLNRYFPDTKRIFSYTAKNGFTGIETRPGAVFRNGKGDYWFGTTDGAVRFTPSKASTESLEPLTHLLGMSVNYIPREMKQGMKLKYNEKTIIFDYNSICLTNPDVVKYKVKLEGADADWQPVTSQTRAIFSSLPAGKYTFMVTASNSQGVWNTDPVTFSFTIKPPFYFSWWFVLIVLVLAAVIIIAYVKVRERSLVREKEVLEEKVKERTAEVVQKSMEIEEKNKDITASIRYAERIQRAMLPRDDLFSETFVLFMPKDIVSGDFYWMHGDKDRQYIAVCDCTGHGVPGAFMSIIGHNSLNKVVREYGITRPASILDRLNTEVLKALMQRNEEVINDGMDMGLIAFDRKEMVVEYAGAYNPLYLVRKGEVLIYKGDRFPIGMTAISDKKSFANTKVEVQPGDMLYMCSDGYADQFGSDEIKKYKSGNVKKLLSEIWSMPVEEQKKRLLDETLAWRGNLPQVDDILFVGTRIPAN
ncbi:MAG TPA: two-component regulator propeller domain-containing protein [Bacteroidales bacterium]|nr:two-component regulator propeller domain-containing protein [Bacteroidales bacterium]